MKITNNEKIDYAVGDLLAKLLAKENITIRSDPKYQTAFFDLENRVLHRPVWKNISQHLFDMLTIHEVGHALETVANEWVDAINQIGKENHNAVMVVNSEPVDNRADLIKQYLNIVEDIRIDRHQKIRYPGSRKDYAIGYKELLLDRDLMKIKDNIKSINNRSFGDRINIYFKGGKEHIPTLVFSNEENKILTLLEKADTFSEVVKLANIIYKMDNNFWENKRKEQEEIEKRKKNYSKNDNHESDSVENIEFDTEEEDDDKSKSKKILNEGIKSYQELEKSLQDLTDKAVSSNKFLYLTFPKPVLSSIIDDYKVVLQDFTNNYDNQSKIFTSISLTLSTAKNNLSVWKKNETPIISFMINEFNMKQAAEVASKIRISPTGIINTNKLHSYLYNEDIFRKNIQIPKGKNHGFVMFVDWSGSMNNIMPAVMKQIFSLTMFCRKMNIPFEVYAFREITYQENEKGDVWQINKNEKTLICNNFKLRNILSSRMNTNEFNNAMLFCSNHSLIYQTDPLGGTPLNEAIIVAPHIINKFKEQTKTEIVTTIFLTDGVGNGIYQYFDSERDKIKKIFGEYDSENIIMTDIETKKQYYVKDGNFKPFGANTLTKIGLQILRDKTKTNVIGFYLFDFSGYSSKMSKSLVRNSVSGYYYMNEDETNIAVDELRNKNVFAIKDCGYDTYYFINPSSILNTVSEIEKINPQSSKKNNIKLFSKHVSKQKINRSLLSKFISEINGIKNKEYNKSTKLIKL